ncbi:MULTISPECIES: trypsin-like serine protease [Micromonospora]|uniref:trypsin-like serine protease n=1 Tax=Micromonospora TaxID=1873 RepID=UPI0011CEA01E|nr:MULTISPECIES: trypsin-like serine protease [Micromonospora]NES15312.1 S1 family peptidase [Micromonospora sp. PPF5-17B]NES36103.1 S1 family peptidase [Micromonospora solifontis]NES56660.1 S1 family peptidase [Micromonospora sp. PPF5-6]
MIVAGVAVACTIGATAVGVSQGGDADRAPVAATAVERPGVDDPVHGPVDDPTATAQAGLGSRGGGTTSPGGRPASTGAAATTAARPAAQVAAAAPASVGYLRERYGVSATEAARRLALQEYSGPLADRLAADQPGTYGGMWLDQTAGGVLVVAATDPAAVRAAVADAPDAAHVRVVTVRHPLRRLTDAAARLATTLGGTVGEDVVVDPRRNALAVLTGGRIAADDSRLTAALAAAGVPATARPRPAGVVPKACDPRYCAQAPMRGGIRLDVPRDDGTVGGCTVGFNIRSRVGQWYILTAGHCVVGGRHQHVDQTWHQYLGPKVPVSVESTAPVLAENAFPNDYAIMPYQPGALQRWQYPGAAGPSLVNYWCVADNPACTASRDVPITGYVPYSAIQTGWVVCATGSGYTPKSGEVYVDSGAGAGYVPGTRCGEIYDKTGGGIDVHICARPGDSGGPLFTESDGKALGILSDGDPGSGPCTNPDERNHYAPVSTILARVNALQGGPGYFQLATRGPGAGLAR